MAQNQVTFQRPIGWTIYFQVRSNNTAWNGSGFVAITSGAWSTLALAMTDANSVGAYAGTFPPSVPAGTSYGLVAFKQAGGSPSASDVAVGTANFSWDGANLGAVTVGAAGLPSPPPLGYGPIGTGAVAVSHNYPTTGNLTFQTAAGAGIGGATIKAYLAGEYAVGLSAATVRGQTVTLNSGAWANVIDLDPGDYVLTFDAPGYQTRLVALSVA